MGPPDAWILTAAPAGLYDRAVNARVTLPLVLILGGCAAARPPVGTTSAEEANARASAAQDAERETARAREERIRELEAQLALAHAEARALRAELRNLEARPRHETTRIVHAEPEPPPEAPPTSEPRPMLRLYGAPAQTAVVAGPPPPVVAAAPPLPSLRLPVAHAPGTAPDRGVPLIPEAPIVVAPRAPTSEAGPRDDGAVQAYREALAHVSARRFEEGLAGLDAFLRAYPDHPYAGNAMYWRGEIHYARRDYRQALSELSRLVERYPGGSKVPEALLRIGLCHARMGEAERAQRTFERLRTQFPGSVAAQMAAREDV